MGETAYRLWEFIGIFHPLVVHFPIALFIAALMAEVGRILGLKWCKHIAIFNVVLGTMAAVAAGVTGISASQHFGATDLLDSHRYLAIATTCFGAIMTWASLRYIKNEKRSYQWKYLGGLVILAGLVGATGHMGGQLTYGETHMDDALDKLLGREKVEEVISVPEKVEFERDVVPILENKCYSCHAGTKKKGGVKLDEFGAKYWPEQDILKEVIETDDPDWIMPPPDKPQLTTEEKEILLKWLK